MRIGIDARMLDSGFGLGRYAQQLVLHLQKIDKENQYILFLRKDNYAAVKIVNDNFKKALADIPWYSWQEQIEFAKIIRKEKVDLMHFLHWNAPYFYNDPFVVTIHDLIMFHFSRPEATTLGPMKFWIKDKAHRLVVARAVKKAKHILVTSEFTKHDIGATLQIPLEKMTTTYQAPFKPEFEISSAGSEEVLKKYKITEPFALYVGSAYPHKNLFGLLKAWRIFEEKYGHKCALVLVGKESYFYEQLKQSQEFADLKKKPILTGLVSDMELSQIYQHASLYVFPSFYEGFGLPPLEAIFNNVPVVSSNRSSLPEVLGEAALYFDPDNFAQMAEVIYTGLANEEIRFELRRQARAELSRYSWENLAKKTVEVYKNSLN